MTVSPFPIASAILAGDLPAADYPLWEDKVWTIAAESAIDCEDESELRWMIGRQEERDTERNALARWQARNPRKVVG